MLRRVIALSTLLLSVGHASVFAGSENALATGFVTFGDGGSLSIEAASFSGGDVIGTVTYRAIVGVDTVIQLDCMSFIPGGNVTTLGGSLYASGVELASGQRYFMRLTDQFGEPGRFGAFVAVTTTAGTEDVQCKAEDLQGDPITAGDFLYVRPA